MNPNNPVTEALANLVNPANIKGIWVRATNTTKDDKAQSHTIIDKWLMGHEIAPGQSKELEMSEQDVERFNQLMAKGHPVKLVMLPRQRAAEEAPATSQQSTQPQQQASDGASGASGSAPAAAATPAQTNTSSNKR